MNAAGRTETEGPLYQIDPELPLPYSDPGQSEAHSTAPINTWIAAAKTAGASATTAK